ncbi:MAG: hypothetical protein EOP84_18425 [Verrucomicrobiaceae bacterium]|nr:MAG: hypothetical protein EOP84_18425 [Verrucomicrobiaceae bacterium]
MNSGQPRRNPWKTARPTACDIELEFAGPTPAVLNKWAADTLRRLAGLIEQGMFVDGHHDVLDNVGKKFGTIYVDNSEVLGDIGEAGNA